MCGDNSLITCSRLEMFTLNIWDVIQLALCAIFVLTVFLVKILFYIYFFLLCAFVAMRNSSYRKTPCHQHWSEWCGKGFRLLEMSFCTYHNPNIFPICLALMVWVLSWRGVRMCESVNIKGEGHFNSKQLQQQMHAEEIFLILMPFHQNHFGKFVTILA